MLEAIQTNTIERVLDVDPEGRTERPTLEEVVDQIAADARQEPLAYLRETRVPEGGE
jgi:hypothetical protein